MSLFSFFKSSKFSIGSLFLPAQDDDFYIKHLCNFFVDYVFQSKPVYCSSSDAFNTDISKERLFIGTHGQKGKTEFQFLKRSKYRHRPREWFKLSKKESIKLALVHCCYGDEILRNNIYKETFIDWTSYTGKISIITGTKELDSIWKTIFNDSLKSLTNSENSMELKRELRRIYSRELMILKRSPNFSSKKRLEEAIWILYSNIESKH